MVSALWKLCINMPICPYEIELLAFEHVELFIMNLHNEPHNNDSKLPSKRAHR